MNFNNFKPAHNVKYHKFDIKKFNNDHVNFEFNFFYLGFI